MIYIQKQLWADEWSSGSTSGSTSGSAEREKRDRRKLASLILAEALLEQNLSNSSGNSSGSGSSGVFDEDEGEEGNCGAIVTWLLRTIPQASPQVCLVVVVAVEEMVVVIALI